MPTANSAVSDQPTTHTSDQPLGTPGPAARKHRLATLGLGIVLGIGAMIPAETLLAPGADARAQPNNCSSWRSTTRPPDYIRVLRRKNGRVQRVPFKRYVVTVMGKEWPSYLPQAVVEAGAVAVKQYAWYHAMGRTQLSRRGECYDVTDGVGDQLYKPGKARVRPDHYRAIQATWNLRLLKSGRLFMTGYRRGSANRCGRDATGWKLYAMSASRCARQGMDFRGILRRYYSPNLELVHGRYGNGDDGDSSQSGQSESRSAIAPTRFVDDRSRDVLWRGTWRRVRAGGALSDTLTYSGIAGSSATFRFTGRVLELVGRRGPERGLVDVYINGTRVARVDMYGASKEPQSTFYRMTWDEAAARTVRLVVVGAPSRPRIDIDAIRVG